MDDHTTPSRPDPAEPAADPPPATEPDTAAEPGLRPPAPETPDVSASGLRPPAAETPDASEGGLRPPAPETPGASEGGLRSAAGAIPEPSAIPSPGAAPGSGAIPAPAGPAGSSATPESGASGGVGAIPAPVATPGVGAPSEPVDPKGPRTRFVINDDLRRSRVLTLLRLPLAVPHMVWLWVFSLAVFLAVPIAWLIGIFLGRIPGGLHRLLASYVRYSTHLNSWLYMAANPFPGFTGTPGYPVDLEIPPPVRQSRLSIAFRALLAIPAVLFLYILSLIQLIVPVAWLVALILGRIPNGLVQPLHYVMRYQSQTSAYLMLTTPRYPSIDD